MNQRCVSTELREHVMGVQNLLMHLALCTISLVVATLAGFGCTDLGETPVEPDIPPDSRVMTISVSNTSALEGAQVIFRVNRTGYAGDSVSFDFATVSGFAFETEDYIATTGTAVIDSGAFFTEIVVASVNDTTLEDGESFSISISNPSHDSATIIDAIAAGQIWDNDGVLYSVQIRPMIQSDCAIASCHGGGSSQGNVNLGTGTWRDVRFATHGGDALIEPKNAAASHLYAAIESGLMPNGLTPWTPAKLKLLEDWINQDAQDN